MAQRGYNYCLPYAIIPYHLIVRCLGILTLSEIQYTGQALLRGWHGPCYAADAMQPGMRLAGVYKCKSLLPA